MAQIFAELARAAGLQLCGGPSQSPQSECGMFPFSCPTDSGWDLYHGVFGMAAYGIFYCSTHPLALDMRK